MPRHIDRVFRFAPVLRGAFILSIAIGISGVFIDVSMAQQAPVIHHITITVKGFDPDAVSVRRGTKVRLVFTTPDKEHSVTPSEFGLAKTMIVPGQETVIEFMPEESGAFTIECTTLCSWRHFLFMRPVLQVFVE